MLTAEWCCRLRQCAASSGENGLFDAMFGEPPIGGFESA
jgi:hypothetical protein